MAPWEDAERRALGGGPKSVNGHTDTAPPTALPGTRVVKDTAFTSSTRPSLGSRRGRRLRAAMRRARAPRRPSAAADTLRGDAAGRPRTRRGEGGSECSREQGRGRAAVQDARCGTRRRAAGRAGCGPRRRLLGPSRGALHPQGRVPRAARRSVCATVCAGREVQCGPGGARVHARTQPREQPDGGPSLLSCGVSDLLPRAGI